ncbi:MAG: class II aldolase/adducin family protein [Actinomycetota bacterium]|nr:class II aldolase/adducin family protein [Actinomycetota bacterium]
MSGSTLSYGAERQEVVAAIRRLEETSVLSRSGHANLSARASDDRMLLTTSGMVRDVTPSDMAVVGLDGTAIEGMLDPTNQEIVEMHSRVYRLRPEVGGIVHTHAPWLLSFAMANQVLPARYEALLRFGQAVDVPVVPWAPRGSDASVSGIVDAFRQEPGTKAVLLGNHGVLVVGESPLAAAALLAVLEEAAEAELTGRAIGGAKDLPLDALGSIRQAMAVHGA